MPQDADTVRLLKRTYVMLNAVLNDAEIEDADIDELRQDIWAALHTDGTE